MVVDAKMMVAVIGNYKVATVAIQGVDISPGCTFNYIALTQGIGQQFAVSSRQFFFPGPKKPANRGYCARAI